MSIHTTATWQHSDIHGGNAEPEALMGDLTAAKLSSAMNDCIDDRVIGGLDTDMLDTSELYDESSSVASSFPDPDEKSLYSSKAFTNPGMSRRSTTLSDESLFSELSHSSFGPQLPYVPSDGCQNALWVESMTGSICSLPSNDNVSCEPDWTMDTRMQPRKLPHGGSGKVAEVHFDDQSIAPIYKCSYCDASFQRFETYKAHKSLKHGINGKKSFYCSICVNSFGSNADCDRHMREVHGFDKEGRVKDMYPCPWVDCQRHLRGFGRKSNLKEHMRRVHDDKYPTQRHCKSPGKIGSPHRRDIGSNGGMHSIDATSANVKSPDEPISPPTEHSSDSDDSSSRTPIKQESPSLSKEVSELEAALRAWQNLKGQMDEQARIIFKIASKLHSFKE